MSSDPDKKPKRLDTPAQDETASPDRVAQSQRASVAAAETQFADLAPDTNSPSAKPRVCLQCGYPLPIGLASSLCTECGTPTVWSLEAYPLHAEPVRSLRSIRSGVTRLVVGCAAFVLLFLVRVVMVLILHMEIPVWLSLSLTILQVVALCWLFVSVGRLRPHMQNELENVQRALNVGALAIRTGLVLVGLYWLEVLVQSTARFVGVTVPGPFSRGSELHAWFGAAAIALELTGWALWGSGCVVIAEIYLARLRAQAPPRLRSSYLLILWPAAVCVSQVFIAVWHYFSGMDINNYSIAAATSRFACLGPLAMLLAIILAIAGVSYMWRLRRELDGVIDASEGSRSHH
jgi:hypothetical protein